MIALGTCPVCGEGQAGFRQCADRQTLVILCDNCAFLWIHPAQFDPDHALDPLSPDLNRKHPAVVLRPSRWATAEDMDGYGWGAYLLTPDRVSP